MLADLENVSVASASPGPSVSGNESEEILFVRVPVKVSVWRFVTTAVCALVADAWPAAFDAVTCERTVEPTSAETSV